MFITIIVKKMNASKFFPHALRTKVSNKIKTNHFNNVEQNTSKLFLLFWAHILRSWTKAVILCCFAVIKHHILSLWIKIFISNNNHACMLSYFYCIWLSATLWLQPARLLCIWDSPGKNTGVGRHAHLQGIFPTQESNLCPLPWHQVAKVVEFQL